MILITVAHEVCIVFSKYRENEKKRKDAIITVVLQILWILFTIIITRILIRINT